MKLLALTAAAFVSASAAMAEPQTPLREVGEIRESLLAVGIALRITEKCPDIRPRYIRGITYLNTIKQRARDLGYSESTIDAFVNSEEDKKLLKTEGLRRLAAQGATGSDVVGYCNLGRREMAGKTLIGSFLW